MRWWLMRWILEKYDQLLVRDVGFFISSYHLIYHICLTIYHHLFISSHLPSHFHFYLVAVQDDNLNNFEISLLNGKWDCDDEMRWHGWLWDRKWDGRWHKIIFHNFFWWLDLLFYNHHQDESGDKDERWDSRWW